MNKIIKLLFLITGAMLFSACANNPNSQVNQIGSKQNLRGINISNIQSRRVGNLYTARATIENTTQSTIQLYYRCVYFDQQMFQIDDDTPWQPLLIYANQVQQVKCDSTNSQINSFKVDISAAGKANNVF